MNTQTRTDWLAQRRTGIGGSDVAAILGLSKWRTPLDVYLDKRGESAEQSDNPAMRWGRALEPVVLNAYADETGREVLKTEGIIAHPEHDWMLANLDGFTEEPRVVEVKTARMATGWGEPGTDEVPDDYALQVQHYMAVTGFPEADIAVLIGGSDFRIYTVRADPDLERSVFLRLQKFWQQVQDGIAPEPVNYSDAVQRFGHSGAAGYVSASAPVERAVVELRRLRDQRAAIEEQENEQKAIVFKALGDQGDTLIDPAGRTLATWRLAKGRESFDTAAFKAAHPSLYPQFTKTGEASRRLLIKD